MERTLENGPHFHITNLQCHLYLNTSNEHIKQDQPAFH